LVERHLAAPFTKDYDAIPGNRPTDWPTRFDLSTWELFSARENGHVLGCAAIAFDAPGLDSLGGRSDLAVLWDIRVDPQSRRRGIGRELFAEAARRARRRNARWLSGETQNINVPACRFYVREGCTLGAVNRFAYADLRDEVQLVWYKSLVENAAS
jgi:ribosomal protein S18 acetylase RimI-like enzyme